MLGRPGRSGTARRIGRGVVLAALVLACGCRSESSRSAAPPADATSRHADSRPATGISIRVRLAPEVDAVEIAADGPCELRDANGAVLAAWPDRLQNCRISPAAAERGFRLSEQVWPYEMIEIVPAQDGELRLKLPGMNDLNGYQGTLRCHLTRSGRIDIINDVDVEDYLRGVVTGEMPDWFEPEALGAQAIAARTYALHQRNTVGRNRTWDVRADQGSQVYQGLLRQPSSPAAMNAVNLTRGVVCVWDSPAGPKIFCAYYSAVCGGCTQPAANIGRDVDIPPLSGNVPCDFCAQAKYYRWGPERLGKALIAQNLRERFERFAGMGRIETIELLDPTPDGRPARIRVVDANGWRDSLRAEDFRLGVDSTGRILKSTHFTTTMEGDEVVFSEGRGWGHGVGMCQWGADGLARLGKTAAEILAYYYPGSHLALAYR